MRLHFQMCMCIIHMDSSKQIHVQMYVAFHFFRCITLCFSTYIFDFSNSHDHNWCLKFSCIICNYGNLIINHDFILLDSVSDLLDYINPNQDGNKRDAEALKRKYLGTKVYQILFQGAFKYS